MGKEDTIPSRKIAFLWMKDSNSYAQEGLKVVEQGKKSRRNLEEGRCRVGRGLNRAPFSGNMKTYYDNFQTDLPARQFADGAENFGDSTFHISDHARELPNACPANDRVEELTMQSKYASWDGNL